MSYNISTKHICPVLIGFLLLSWSHIQFNQISWLGKVNGGNLRESFKGRGCESVRVPEEEGGGSL